MNSFLAITYAFMLSYCPYHNIGLNKVQEYHQDPTHASFQLGIDLFDCVNVYAGEDTFQVMNGNVLSWKPYSQSYWLGLEYHKSFSDALNLSVGVTHKCQHSLDAWGEKISGYDFAITELYIGVEGKFDIF